MAPESRNVAAVTALKPAPARPLTRPRIAGGDTRFTVVINGTMKPWAAPDRNHSGSTTSHGGARLVAINGRQVSTASGTIARTWRSGPSRPTTQAPSAAPAGRLAISAAPTTGAAPSVARIGQRHRLRRDEEDRGTPAEQHQRAHRRVVEDQPPAGPEVGEQRRCRSPGSAARGRHRNDTASTAAETAKLTTSSISPARSPTSTITTPAATMPITWSTW